MKIVPPEEESPALQGVPGCGLATYGGLLIVFMVVSLIGSFVSLLAIVFVPGAAGPSVLKHGSEVSVWALQPMRDAGLLELTEAPLAWHDESAERDGTVACAFTDDALIRVEAGQGSELAFASVEELEAVGEEYDGGVVITASGAGERITCTFREEEGGSRFLKQLEVETGLQAVDPTAADPSAEDAPAP